MRLRELMNLLQVFMDNKGKGTQGELGDASVFMHVGNHLEELKKNKSFIAKKAETIASSRVAGRRSAINLDTGSAVLYEIPKLP